MKYYPAKKIISTSLVGGEAGGGSNQFHKTMCSYFQWKDFLHEKDENFPMIYDFPNCNPLFCGHYLQGAVLLIP